ncbi:hypothetical protein [Nocardia asiatica]|uniref:hypothetical protein n=1 Tax=Nocardia asiatica TaxID=209252 RepID=UPI00030D8A4A|nr:hypothetical protein [Nocardia asiatica]
MTYIHDFAEWRYALPDNGFSEAIFELDPSGRIRLIGNEIDHATRDRYGVFGADYSADDIDILADRLKAMVAHSRGAK